MADQQNTFVYAPGVRIYIKSENGNTYDISDDLVDYTVQRRSDGPSTANFSVQNVKRKYDGIFSPNDEVIIELKRVAWVRVFTGLLNSVPLVTLWPRVVAFSASCSLKRIQYWYWDPQLASSWMTATQAMANGRKTSDSGISNVILTLLKEVMNWPESKVHIGAIPPHWFRLVEPYAQQLADALVSSDAQVTQQWSTIAPGSVGGTAVDGSTTSAGAPSSQTASGMLSSFENKGPESGWPKIDNLNNAEIIIRVGKTMGVDDFGIIGALAVSAGESRWKNIDPSNNSSSDGLFQQLASWGTLAQRTDPAWSSRAYYKDYLAKKSQYGRTDPTDVALNINEGGDWHQFSDANYPGHKKFENFSKTLLDYYNQHPPLGSVSHDSVTQTAGASANTAISTSPLTYKDFTDTAKTLINKNPGLPYFKGEVTEAVLRQEVLTGPAKVNGLGCAHFVSWVVMHLFGHLPDQWGDAINLAQAVYDYCKSHGGYEISVANGFITQGAILVHKQNPATNGGHGHVAISLGNGRDVFDSSGPGSGPGLRSNLGGDWAKSFYDAAIYLPGIDYTGAKGNGMSADVIVPTTVNGEHSGTGATALTTVPYSSVSGYNSTNVFDKMFGGLIAPGDDPQKTFESTLALAFSGPRALLNDQPLLPYIKNLVNASMRSFCSAPNGDFMAWFPDYYGLWGTAEIMTIEPIELMDFYVEWTDDYFVTHQYTVAGTVNHFDGFSGNISTTFTPDGTLTPFQDARVVTAGIASIDIPALMYALFGISMTTAQGESFAQYIYRKFGARPDFKEMDGMIGKTAEIFSAMFYFMRQWAYQYNANVPITFMPELWPGMLIQVPAYNFQAYVTAVTHSGQMGEGGGHMTSINVAAPARMPDGSNTHHLIGLPLAAGMLEANANVVAPVDSGMSAQAQKNARLLGGSA